MPPKKTADRRQGRGTVDVGKVSALPVRTVAGVMPECDMSWPDDVQRAWAEFWSSPLADPRILKPTHMMALRRLFGHYARYVDACRRFDEEPETVGSMGQIIVSPWAAEMHRLESAIEKLEDRFGFSPMACLRLGVTFEEGVSLAGRNAELLSKLQQGRK